MSPKMLNSSEFPSRYRNGWQSFVSLLQLNADETISSVFCEGRFGAGGLSAVRFIGCLHCLQREKKS